MFSAKKILSSSSGNISSQFQDIDPSSILETSSLPLENFWIGDYEQVLLENSFSNRLSVERNWDTWRTGTIFDYTRVKIVTNTTNPSTASLVNGAGAEDNNKISIIDNGL